MQTPYTSHPMDVICFLTLITFVVIFGLIMWERIPRMYLAVLGAVLVVALGVFDVQEAVNAVNWETIAFLWGMFLLVEILVEAGFFNWVSWMVAKGLDYDPLKILIFFPILSFVLSALINSITVMLFLSVVTFNLSRHLKFDPLPVVVSEVVLANIGGAATLVGDPPNVILGTALGLGFNDFLIHNGPVALAAGAAAMILIYFMHRKNFMEYRKNQDGEELRRMTTKAQIKDLYLLRCGIAGMAVMLVLLIGRPLLSQWHIPISIALSSLLPAFMILTFGGRRIYQCHFMRRIDSETLLFFIGLFVLIGALEKRFIIQTAADFLASLFKTPAGFISSIFWGGGFFSAFVDNVPLAMAMTFIIKQSVIDHLVPGIGIMVWATSLGVDLGGNLTPIGASANVVAYSYLQKSGIGVGWGRWARLALPPALAAMAVSYIAVLLKLWFKFF